MTHPKGSESVDYDDEECGFCGGEGFTYSCSWDWQCDTYDAGDGTCLCTRRCHCNPPTESTATIKEREQLGQILSEAITQQGQPPC